MKLLLSLSLLILIQNSLWAAKIKIGVLAPEGTNWAMHMKKMGKEIKKKTEGKVDFKFYFGGSQGDENDVLRKVRINQLQGGVFTGKTLGDISGDVRVVEIPYTFGGDGKKAWSTVEKLTPYFNEEINYCLKGKLLNHSEFSPNRIHSPSQICGNQCIGTSPQSTNCWN